jgi:hypothetical protein
MCAIINDRALVVEKPFLVLRTSHPKDPLLVEADGPDRIGPRSNQSIPHFCYVTQMKERRLASIGMCLNAEAKL